MDELVELEIENSRGVTIVRLIGEIDHSNAEQAQGRITEATEGTAGGLIVDLSRTTYLDSSGIHLLFRLSRHMERRQQGFCVVAPETSRGSRVLSITGFERQVPVARDVDEAMARLDAPAPAA